MPIVAHNQLPTFERLRQEGLTVLAPDRAKQQDIRELHIGLLNMMPDAALAATERQFIRLLGGSNPIVQFYIHLFSLPQQQRSKESQAYIQQHYESFQQIQQQGLDALIITGANVSKANMSEEAFWQPLIEVVDWAFDNVTSTYCSCLSSHAVLEFHYQQKRRSQEQKIWGVFPHRVVQNSHPLVSQINTRFDVPHSRWNEVSKAQFEQAGLHILVESEEQCVHLATSADGIRFVFSQGHPEFDTVSLLKEYKREVQRFVTGETETYPTLVKNIFSTRSQAILHEYYHHLVAARKSGKSIAEFPEKFIIPELDNTWRDTAIAVLGNWVGLVYQLTHKERNRPFMEGIDPDNPLSLSSRF